MELWERFYKSGRIEDYLAYAQAERGRDNDDFKGTDTEGDGQR